MSLYSSKLKLNSNFFVKSYLERQVLLNSFSIVMPDTPSALCMRSILFKSLYLFTCMRWADFFVTQDCVLNVLWHHNETMSGVTSDQNDGHRNTPNEYANMFISNFLVVIDWGKINCFTRFRLWSSMNEVFYIYCSKLFSCVTHYFMLAYHC